MLRDVSEERRKRYFTKTDGGYRINKSVRDLCVFVRHDLVRDPPFSKLDLVSCRNVLIYFDQALQKKVLPTLHYCLNQPGFLLLGRSENISGFSQLFSEVDKREQDLRALGCREQPALCAAHRSGSAGGLVRRPRARAVPGAQRRLRQAPRSLAPGSLLPAGRAGQGEHGCRAVYAARPASYLQAAPGQPQSNLIGMARGGLISALRATIAQAKHEMVVVTRPRRRGRARRIDQDV